MSTTGENRPTKAEREAAGRALCEELGIRDSIRVITTKPTEADLAAHQMRMWREPFLGIWPVHYPLYKRTVRADDDADGGDTKIAGWPVSDDPLPSTAASESPVSDGEDRPHT